MLDARQNLFSILLLAMLIGAVTIEMQAWVGDATIYAGGLEAKRESLHNAILTNTPPAEGGWSAVGAAALNIRVGVVYLAEGLRVITGLSVAVVYKLIDTVFLFCALMGLFWYLRKWLPSVYCLVGVLYLSSMLPLSYFLYAFQPWDRIQLVFWIALLYCVRERRLGLCAVLLAASIAVKFDTILLPGLYFLAHVSRAQWRRVALESAALCMVGWGVYLTLKHLLPAPMEPARFGIEGVLRQIPSNIEQMVSMKIRHPPLLVHTLPFLLAAVGFRRWLGNRFISASVLFAAGLMSVWFTFTVFAEVRTQLAALVLVLPAALLSLQNLIARLDDYGMDCKAEYPASVGADWLRMDSASPPTPGGLSLSTKLFRFATVGAVNALIYAVSTSFYISGFGLGGKLASVAGFCTALPFAFFAHRTYTFASKGLLGAEMRRFVATQAVSLLVSVFAMGAAVDYFGLHYAVGIFGAIVLVPLVVFLVLDKWVFSGQGQAGVVGVRCEAE